jgi:hypothetical protein
MPWAFDIARSDDIRGFLAKSEARGAIDHAEF